MIDIHKRLVVGILAHVDAGKTTLSEGLLYTAGTIKKLGRVDHKDAFLDTNPLEKDRGITIFSKQAVLFFGDTQITLLDTPGHVDFCAEMERTLQVLDYAILVISGTDGVQSHTQTLWKLLKRHGIPTYIFVNKMDMPDTNCDAVLSSLERDLGHGFINFSAGISSDPVQENLALTSERAMDAFLQHGKIDMHILQAGIANREIFPTFFGAALKMEGVQQLLEGLDCYAKQPQYGQDFRARVFKITRDAQGNRLTHIKVTGGALQVKQKLSATLANGETWTEKVDRLHIYSGAKCTAIDHALPGDICAIIGLTHTQVGDGLGDLAQTSLSPILAPVLTYQVHVPPQNDAHTILAKLRILEEEDPQLGILWNETLGEIHVQLMGEIQLEILKSVLADRFDLHLEFGQGSIVYKETIEGIAEGVGHFEPLRHYAEVHLLLEGGKPDSGLVFTSTVREDELNRNWQRLILSHLREKTHVGVLSGAAITDMKVTLAAGRAHLKHTEGGDFRQATYRAVRQGLMQAKSVLLEPWYAFTLEVPLTCIGRAMTDLDNLHATFQPPKTHGEFAILQGSAPVATLRSYHLAVTGYTKGLGRLSCTVSHYGPCHNADEILSASDYRWHEDLANTPDSVFCSHGAGYAVPWDEVAEKMHLESVLKPKQTEEYTVSNPSKRSSYQGSLADDKELLSIFEQTYGKIKQRTQVGAGQWGYIKKRSDLPAPEQQVIQGTGPRAEFLLVDGYNIIFSWDVLHHLQNIDEARERLINMLSNYAAWKQVHVILVFDAYKTKGHSGEVELNSGIHIVYTKEAETADMYIEKSTFQLARSNRVRVATSDRLEQLIILGHGATAVSSLAFLEEVEQVEREIRAYMKK